MFEIEVKFRIRQPDAYREELRRRFGITLGTPYEETDLFFQHITRDFHETDECLRLRTSPKGLFVTYKGPKLDGQTKTREEIELPLAQKHSCRQCTVDEWQTFFERLGFKTFAKVVKQRSTGHMEYEGVEYEITLDELPGIGFFSEWETVAYESGEMEEKKVALIGLAQQLGLGSIIRISYLELFLDGKGEEKG